MECRSDNKKEDCATCKEKGTCTAYLYFGSEKQIDILNQKIIQIEDKAKQGKFDKPTDLMWFMDKLLSTKEAKYIAFNFTEPIIANITVKQMIKVAMENPEIKSRIIRKHSEQTLDYIQ